MRLVVQRVKKAMVGSSKIGPGLFVLLGIKKGDDQEDVDLLVSKLTKLRVMADDEGRMNLSIIDVKASILLVSQFTLHADTSGGNRPSFLNAEEPDNAKKIYEYFIEKLKETGIDVQTGTFGNYMEISLVFDGPSTILYLD
ncbi:MAG: D-aminoacyl-tRNA deacylase [Patescibacteria group bacterium]